MPKLLVLVILLLTGVLAEEYDHFPDDLLIGFATASYQIEGGWNEEGKGENIWDRFTHTHPDAIADGSNGDIAADSYHKWKEDAQLLKNIGAQVYRFSISWSRILPSGDIATINQKGIDYYNNLINELLSLGILPLVTIYHWDLPQPLQDLGGWSNPILIDYYVDYARLLFQNFGDRVKWWITFNEPLNVCNGGYGKFGLAPALNSSGIAEYYCTHHIILSHAKTYHMYVDEFKQSQKGQIGITLDGGWQDPASYLPEDIEAAETLLQFGIGWFAHPIVLGDYPPIMRQRIDFNSQQEGRPRSRLLKFTEAQVNYTKRTADFLGINHYTTYLAAAQTIPVGPNPSWDRDVAVTQTQDPSWPSGASSWLKVVPEGIRKHLNWVKNRYDNIPVFVTENGYSDYGGVEDFNRINYYNSYLHEFLKAIYEDGCNVIGYTAWSLLDDFEWIIGYLEKYGIHQVDFNDPNRTRTPKLSADFFKEILSSRTLPPLNTTLRRD